jgi:hypothetical protein
MTSDLKSQYEHLDNEQLLEVASDRASLTEEARVALETKLRERGLTDGDASDHEKFVKWSSRREERIFRAKLFGTNKRRKHLLWMLLFVLLGCAVLVLLDR